MRISKFLLTLTASLMLVPATALAHDGQTEAESTGSPTPKLEASRSPQVARPKVEAAAFCTRFTDATGQVSDDTTGRFNDLQTKFTQRGDKIKTEFKTVDQKITDSRAGFDKQRAENFTKLDAKATTD
jgi:hypothetical protein